MLLEHSAQFIVSIRQHSSGARSDVTAVIASEEICQEILLNNEVIVYEYDNVPATVLDASVPGNGKPISRLMQVFRAEPSAIIFYLLPDSGICSAIDNQKLFVLVARER